MRYCKQSCVLSPDLDGLDVAGVPPSWTEGPQHELDGQSQCAQSMQDGTIKADRGAHGGVDVKRVQVAAKSKRRGRRVCACV